MKIVNVQCTHEMLKEMIDKLDKECTRKIANKFKNAENEKANKYVEQTRVDVAEIYSLPRWKQWRPSWDSVQDSVWI